MGRRDILQPDYGNVVDKEGRRLASLDAVELQDLKDRAEAWYERNPNVNNAKVDVVYNATIHYLDKLSHATVQDAFDRFAELRREAIKAGYVTPSISGTPPKSQILTVNGMLEALLKKMREAIARAEPLPDEPEEVTRAIIAGCQSEITTEIKAINEAIDNPYPGIVIMQYRGGNYDRQRTA